VRPLVDAWKTRDGGAVPSKEAIAAAMKRVDLANVDVTNGKVTVRNGAMFEEGGWGKGLAIDRMLGVFKQKGTKRVRINFGGQIGQYGDQPYVTIANPLKRDAPAVGLSLGKRSISTSSGSEKSFTVGDKTFTHLIDPRTGVALPPRGSVSVLSDSAFDADVLSTALYVMGPEAGMYWAKAHNVIAIFITDKNEILTSAPMPSLQVLDAKFTAQR
jgi:thiamine biosynthesis lipoprotein